MMEAMRSKETIIDEKKGHSKIFFFQFKILHANTTVLISKNDMVPYHPT
jgi:hypothetical protein